MPIDVTALDSPGWWFAKLFRQMAARSVGDKLGRRDRLDLLHSYLVGRAPLPGWTTKQQDNTREFLKLARQQYPLLISEALLHRVRWLGLRTMKDQDANGDDKVREIAAASGFAAVSADAMLNEFGLSEGYLFINPPDAPAGHPLPVFTSEDPRRVITAQDPLRPLITRAGLKLYVDEDRELDFAHVFTPGRVDVAYRKKSSLWGGFRAESWEWDEELSGPYPEGMGLERVVPLVKLTNRLGLGEFEPHLDLINRMHHTVANRLWITTLQAHRQLAVKGKLDDVDEEGNRIDYDEVLSRDPGAVWTLPEDTELWESGQLDLTPVLSSVRDDTRELSAVSSTPMYMFSPDAAGGSAEGASLQRESITFKADDRVARNTPPMLAAWRIALLMAGEKERADGFLQPMWAPTERYSLQQRGAAAVQARTSGVPWRSTMSEAWQYDPDTVARMETERAEDLLYQPEQAAAEASADETATGG